MMTVVADHPGATGPITQTIRKRIRERIDQIGWDDHEVAAKVGMSRSNFSRLMSGKVEFNLERLDKIAAVLEVKHDWLLELQMEQHETAEGAWNARYGHPTVLFEKFAAHQRLSNEI